MLRSWATVGRIVLRRPAFQSNFTGQTSRRLLCSTSTLDGSINTNSAEFLANTESMNAHIAEVRALNAKGLLGGGEKYVAKHRSRGKMMARERVSALLDPGSPFLELSSLAAHALYGKEEYPAAGLVTGIGTVHGRKCMVVANDATVKGGTSVPMTVKKQVRAQQIAEENRLPCVYLLESGGANLPMQAEIFPDMYHGGRCFYNMANLSAQGIPQISVVLGSCTAGGAYAATMADQVVIVRDKGTIFLGGPPLVKAATGEVVTAEDLGGAELHCKVSGCADHLAEDEPHAIRIARELVKDCAPPPVESLPRVPPVEPLYKPSELNGIVPSDFLRKPMPIRKVLARILDGSQLREFKANYGSTLITGFGQVHGYQVGVIANDGILFSESALKGSHFIQLCCQRGIPLLFVQNITGFMVGKQYEEGGIAKNGAKLVHAVSNAKVPKFTLVVGGSFGAGNYGMCGRAFGSRFMWMWPNAKIGVMGGEQAAKVLVQVQTEAAAKVGKEIPPEKLEQMRTQVQDKFDSEAGALYSTARLWDDGIIEPEQTREVLALGLSTAANAPIPDSKFGVFRM